MNKNIELLEKRMWRVIGTLETLERDYNERMGWERHKVLTNFIYGDVDNVTKELMYRDDLLEEGLKDKQDNDDKTITDHDKI